MADDSVGREEPPLVGWDYVETAVEDYVSQPVAAHEVEREEPAFVGQEQPIVVVEEVRQAETVADADGEFSVRRRVGHRDVRQPRHAANRPADRVPKVEVGPKDSFRVGRAARKQNALPVGHPEPNLPQALHMIAGPTYTAKIPQEGGRLDQLLRKGASDEEIIDEFYRAALTRAPEPDEKEELLRHLAQRQSRRNEELSRLVWAILSSREFAYNH